MPEAPAASPGSKEGRDVSLTQPGTLCSDTFRVCGDELPAKHMAYFKSNDIGLHMNMNVGSLATCPSPVRPMNFRIGKIRILMQSMVRI